MSNHWLRLWHDMPNDPKWRTIARISEQPISLVQAVYIHLLVDASRNVTRGHVTVTFEDLASALDCAASQIEDIYNAMQGRVLDGNELTGWALRQPKREDAGNPATGAKSAAQRKREQRERERKKEALEGENVTNVTDVTENVTSHEMSRNGHDSVTDKRDINNDKKAKNCSQTLESKGLSRMSRNVTLDTDTDTEKHKNTAPSDDGLPVSPKPEKPPKPKIKTRLTAKDLINDYGLSEQLAAEFLQIRKDKRQTLTPTAMRQLEREATKAGLTAHDAIRQCCANGWGGFKASWMQDKQPAAQTETYRERAIRMAKELGMPYEPE